MQQCKTFAFCAGVGTEWQKCGGEGLVSRRCPGDRLTWIERVGSRGWRHPRTEAAPVDSGGLVCCRIANLPAALVVKRYGGLVKEVPITLPFQVLGHFCFQEELDELAVGHDELRDQIDVPVAVLAKILRGLSSGPEKFPHVGQIHRSSLASVEWVSVNVKHSLP